MTNDEKYKLILERIKQDESSFEPTAVSMMVIIGYMQTLIKMGMLESEIKMTNKGNKVIDICEKFDWKPSDTEIMNFVVAMVPQPDQLAFAHLIKQYRDNREALLEEWKQFKKDENKS